MNRYVNLGIAVAAGIAAAFAVLPYGWAQVTAGAIAAGIGMLHSSLFAGSFTGKPAPAKKM